MTQRRSLFGGGIWTIGSYGASLSLRLLSNVILSHILAPDAIGILFIVSTLRVGVELLTDVGVEQNIIHNSKGLEPDFLNSAWTIQIIRGVLVSLLFLGLSYPLAQFYAIDPWILVAMSLSPLFNSLSSVSIFVLVRTLRVRDRNVFELSSELLSFIVTVSLALYLRNVWALILGSLCAVLIRSALSYLIPHPRHSFSVRREHASEIIHFGKWIFVSSFLTYVANNIDRIILGRYLAVDLLGIFGLAKIISEIPPTLANRISYQIVFPSVAASRGGAEDSTLRHLHHLRTAFVLAASVGLGILAAFSDVAINLLYDPRYHAAGWILFGLLVGAWFAVISSLNEATLLGAGKPRVIGYSNAIKFFVLTAILPFSLIYFGLPGAVAAIVLAELLRFVFLLARQERGGLVTRVQDIAVTMLFLFVVAALSLIRTGLGLGTSWSGMLS